MEENKIVKSAVKILILLVIVFTGWLTYVLFKMTGAVIVVLIGIILGGLLRRFMSKIEETAFQPLTTEEKEAKARRHRKTLAKFSNLLVPLFIILMILLSSSGAKKALKDFIKSFAQKHLQEEKSVEGRVYGENNLKDGNYAVKFPDGTIKRKFTIKNGRLEGKSYHYYQDGQLREARAYKNGKLHGKYEAYDRDGKLAEKRFYKNGKEVEEAPKG